MVSDSPPPIVITAPSLPDPAAERAFAVERIDSGRIANSPSAQLEQLLRNSPGIQLFRRSDTRSGHPTSQGITMRALGGNASSRVQIILDGVPQADPFGGWVYWPAYDPLSLAQIRIIRGGGSVIHGPGALAGAIEMRTRVDPGVTASIEGGSRNSISGRARFATRLAGGTFALATSGARGDGFVPVTSDTRGPADRPADYRHGSARAYWTASVGGETDLEISAITFADRRERGLAFTGNRSRGADAAIQLIGRGPWQWRALGYGQWRELRSSFASTSPGREVASRVSLQDSVPGNAVGASFELRPPLGEGAELRLGGDTRLSEGESRELYSYDAGSPTRRRIAGGRTGTAGLFSEITAQIGSLTVTGGGRLDHWRVVDGTLREWIIASGEPLRNEEYGQRSGWLPTARGGAFLDLGKGANIRSAAYRGWRMPTLNELFRPFRAGSDATAANPTLDPERLAGAEIGANVQRGAFAASLTAFSNRLSYAIANVRLGSGPGNFPGVGFVAAGGTYRQRQNLRAIIVRGFEASAEVREGPWLLRLGTSLTHARVRADGTAAPLDSLRPAQTPRTVHSAGLGWRQGDAAASIELRRIGAQFEDDLNRRQLPAATTIDAFGAVPVAPGMQLFVRGENLLNERVIAGIGGDGTVERATPRTLWLGLRFAASERP